MTNTTVTPNELEAQKAQLASVPQSNSGHGTTQLPTQDWKPLGNAPMGGYKPN